MRPIQLPFVHLNLRRNPFGEVPLSERADLAVVDVEALVPRLAAPGLAVQFVGEKGRGKTTHLLALRARFPGAPYVHLPEDGPLPQVPTGPLVFVDESQRLPRRRRGRLFRSCGSLVLGTHEDHAAELAAAGLSVETRRVGGIGAARLERALTRRIEAARRGPGPVPRLPAAAIAALQARFGDDVRAIEHHLYEVFQGLEAPCDVEV